VANAVAAYLDALGPSRASGMADTVNPWDDTVSIFGLGSAALSATDVDGTTKLLDKVLANGVTIAVGSGSPATVDYQPADDGNNAPELAVAARVFCTQ
jgi:hypothetical protein